MTPDSIRFEIQSHINASWDSTLIVYPNRVYKTEGIDWIRPTIKLGKTFEGEKGVNGLGLRPGILMIDIFTEANTGSKTGLDYAGTLESLFRRREVGGIMFDEPYSEEKGTDPNGQYHTQTIAPFSAWVGE